MKKILNKFDSLINKLANTATVPESKSKRLVFYADILKSVGIEPLKFLGQGKFNTAFLCDYNGHEAVAKVTFSKKDADISYNFKIIKNVLSKDCQKHMPEIYDVLHTDTNPKAYIILVEKLNPLNKHLLSLMFGRDEVEPDLAEDPQKFKSVINENSKKILNINSIKLLKDTNFIHKLIYKAIEDINLKDKLNFYLIKEIIKELTIIFLNFNIDNPDKFNNEKAYKIYLENELDKLSHTINDKLFDILFLNENLVKFNRDEIIESLNQYIDKLIKNIFFIGKNLGTFPIDADVYVHDLESNKEKHTLSRVLPESKSLMKCLDILKNDYGIKFSDLHAENLMERPGTRDIVISDPGYFNFT